MNNDNNFNNGDNLKDLDEAKNGEELSPIHRMQAEQIEKQSIKNPTYNEIPKTVNTNNIDPKEEERRKKEKEEKERKKRIREIVTYIIMIIIMIIIILLLLRFCSINSGKKIYRGKGTTSTTMTTTIKVNTSATTRLQTQDVNTTPTDPYTTNRVTGELITSSRKTTTRRTTTTKAPTTNKVTPSTEKPTQAPTTEKTTQPVQEPVYTYSFTKPTSETQAVKIYKDGALVSGSVYVFDMSGNLLSTGIVGANAVITITIDPSNPSTKLANGPKLQFCFSSDVSKKYTMTLKQ